MNKICRKKNAIWYNFLQFIVYEDLVYGYEKDKKQNEQIMT